VSICACCQVTPCESEGGSKGPFMFIHSVEKNPQQSCLRQQWLVACGYTAGGATGLIGQPA
jgi:hypothetical protein